MRIDQRGQTLISNDAKHRKDLTPFSAATPWVALVCLHAIRHRRTLVVIVGPAGTAWKFVEAQLMSTVLADHLLLRWSWWPEPILLVGVTVSRPWC